MADVVDVNIINPFIVSMVNVFKTMARTEVQRTSLALKQNDKVFGEITAVIGLAGSGSGTVMISFPSHLARTLVSRMLLCDEKSLNREELRDGVGEIINMVAGSAKSSFSNTQYKFNISLPTILEGDPANLEIGHKKDVPCIEVGFETAEHVKFVLEVSLKANPTQ